MCIFTLIICLWHINLFVYPCAYTLHPHGNCGCLPILELMQANCIDKHHLSHEVAICQLFFKLKMCQNVLINAFFEEVWRYSFTKPVAITTRQLIGLCCRGTHFQLLSNYSRLVRMLSLHLFWGLNMRSHQRGCSFIMHCSALCVIHPSLIIRCTTSFPRAAPASDLLP